MSRPTIWVSIYQLVCCLVGILSIFELNFRTICSSSDFFLFQFVDMGAIEALADALKAYNGGVLLVSHDQHFITSVCKEIWVIQNRKVTVFDGSFNDYKKSVVSKIRKNSKK